MLQVAFTQSRFGGNGVGWDSCLNQVGELDSGLTKFDPDPKCPRSSDPETACRKDSKT